MSTPTVSWPQDPQRPVSTMLELTNEQPVSLRAEFSCAAARVAGATADGVVLSTIVPDHPAAGSDGLLVTVRDGALSILDRGRDVLAEDVPAGDCRYSLRADAGALTVDRDGVRVASVQPRAGTGVLPDVDVLVTSADRLPAADDLRVELTVDDQFNSTPAPAKKVLIAVLLLSAIGSLVALRRQDRRQDRRPAPSEEAPAEEGAVRGGAVRRLVVLVDVAVIGTMALWWFIAPLSDDDGYYAAMARNSDATGFVGNYYQLLNQSFTPFTWFYRVLGWWQVVGDSPVVLRVPALALGLGTWVLLRRFLARPGALPAAWASRPWPRLGAFVLLGLTFLAWWLPYGMGVRPEAVVGFLATVVLVCVAAGLRGGRLFPFGVAFGAAGLAIACHPTGFVALAPLLVALPRLIPLVREGADRITVLTRTVLLLAPGAFPVAAAFADGTLHEFLRAQELFVTMSGQNHWYDEWQRYMFLLSPNPMGSYAKRAAVLLALVALGWFVALAVAARMRGVRMSPALRLAGPSLGLAFLMLWLTPSKWTHHFGAMFGLGPAFLTLVLVSAPALVREVTGGRRIGWPVPLAVLGSGVVAFALSFQGPNQWAYTWLPGMPHAGVPPFVGPVSFGSLLVWAVVAVLVVAGVALWRRRRAAPDERRGAPPWLVAVPLVVTVFLGTTLGYLVGGFGYATLRTVATWSPWADALTDPLSHGCDAAGAVRVTDLDAARPLDVAVPAPPPDPGSAFVTDGGWFQPGPPPTPVGKAASSEVWGSLVGPDGEDRTGSMTTSWYRLPDVGEGQDLVVLAAGLLGEGNRLTVEYGSGTGAGQPTVVHTQELTDTEDAPIWRTFTLDVAAARADGATSVRLVAEDLSGGNGGWLAFTGPSVAPLVPLTRYLPAGAPVALAWQLAFLFPCQRQPLTHFGITEPARYGVLWVDNPQTSGVHDATWTLGRGGLFAPIARTSSMTELAGVIDGSPGVEAFQVQRFGLPYPVDAYDLHVERTERLGWQGP
nr:arabinosyltransferase domain-containing protein [Petropleomorpha daqingensis]